MQVNYVARIRLQIAAQSLSTAFLHLQHSQYVKVKELNEVERSRRFSQQFQEKQQWRLSPDAAIAYSP